MKHLLLTRFQGALIGGNTIYLNPVQVVPNRLLVDLTPTLMAGINSLVHPRRFNLYDWAQNILPDTASPDRAIVAMLPLMLFFHEDRLKLREIIINVSHTWQLDWETCSSAVAIGYIISRSLTESFNPRTIIGQLLAEMTNLQPTLVQALGRIDDRADLPGDQLEPLDHQWSGRSGSLQQLTTQLTATAPPIIVSTVIAIDCLCATPEDFGVATRRAYHAGDRSQLTCALAGIIAGAQNSVAGIPLNGLLATTDRAQWLLAVTNLLSAWAGVYPAHHSIPGTTTSAHAATTAIYPLAVASPQVMQRRS
jgi:ADP-ribosylglycohydrolase